MGATAVFVAHDDPGLLRRTMLADLSIPFPVMLDPDRSRYRAWGLRRASLARIWLDPTVWRQYTRLLWSGEALRGFGHDTRQLGGDFVIDPAGVVAYARPQRRDDRPPVGRLLRCIEELGPPS